MILYFVFQQIEVETLEKGFLVNVYSERSCPGLLVSILQVLEDLGLNVLEARVSCTDTFRLQAFGGEVIIHSSTISSQIFSFYYKKKCVKNSFLSCVFEEYN